MLQNYVNDDIINYVNKENNYGIYNQRINYSTCHNVCSYSLKYCMLYVKR